jgi:hypothetical protein
MSRLLCATLLGSVATTSAVAQTTTEQSVVESMAAELRAMRARIDALESEVTTLRAKEAPMQTATPAPRPSWDDGAPTSPSEVRAAAVTSRTGDDTPLEKLVFSHRAPN